MGRVCSPGLSSMEAAEGFHLLYGNGAVQSRLVWLGSPVHHETKVEPAELDSDSGSPDSRVEGGGNRDRPVSRRAGFNVLASTQNHRRYRIQAFMKAMESRRSDTRPGSAAELRSGYMVTHWLRLSHCKKTL